MDELGRIANNRATRRGFLKRGLGTLAGAFAVGPLTSKDLFERKDRKPRYKILAAETVPIPEELREPVAAAKETLLARGFEVLEGQAVRFRVVSPDGVDEVVMYQTESLERGGTKASITAVLSQDVGPTFEVQAGISRWRGKDLRGIEYWRWNEGAMVHSARIAVMSTGTLSRQRTPGAALTTEEFDSLVTGFHKTRQRLLSERSCCNCIISEINEGGVTCAIATVYLCGLLTVICGPFAWACGLACGLVSVIVCSNAVSCWDACYLCGETGQCGSVQDCDVCCL